MKKRNMKKREEDGLGRGEEERRKSIGKKTGLKGEPEQETQTENAILKQKA